MTTPLEDRYRRLLRLYPREHRREYEEEMIGVLLAGAAPGRRGPGPREVLDLVLSALTARWQRGAAALRDENWCRAAWAAQVFGTILLLAVGLRRVVMVEAAGLRYPAHVPHVPVHELARPAAWALVLLLALAGWRWVAVPAAWGGVVAEALPRFEFYLDTPAMLLNAFWFLAATAVVGVASLMTARGGRAGASAAGRVPPGTALVALAGALIVLAGWGFAAPSEPSLILGSQILTYPALVLNAVAALVVALAVFRQPGPVVRREVVMAVPVLVAVPLVRVGFGDLIEFNMRNPDRTILLGPVQWAALVVVPLAAMWVAATLNRRLEQSRAEQPSV